MPKIENYIFIIRLYIFNLFFGLLFFFFRIFVLAYLQWEWTTSASLRWYCGCSSTELKWIVRNNFLVMENFQILYRVSYQERKFWLSIASFFSTFLLFLFLCSSSKFFSSLLSILFAAWSTCCSSSAKVSSCGCALLSVRTRKCIRLETPFSFRVLLSWLRRSSETRRKPRTDSKKVIGVRSKAEIEVIWDLLIWISLSSLRLPFLCSLSRIFVGFFSSFSALPAFLHSSSYRYWVFGQGWGRTVALSRSACFATPPRSHAQAPQRLSQVQ